MSTNYEVIFEPFTERHFIRTFAKKYKGAWKFTLDALLQEFRFFDELFLKNTAETIVDSAEVKRRISALAAKTVTMAELTETPVKIVEVKSALKKDKVVNPKAVLTPSKKTNNKKAANKINNKAINKPLTNG